MELGNVKNPYRSGAEGRPGGGRSPSGDRFGTDTTSNDPPVTTRSVSITRLLPRKSVC